jgi:transposase
VNAETKEILDVYNDVGKTHDFQMFKDSLVGVLPEDTSALLDSGYQGVNEYFINAIIPYKATKNNPLTDEQKAFNKLLAKYRVAIEHINREIKIFRICKETYRGKGERGLERVKIIAALCNLNRSA